MFRNKSLSRWGFILASLLIISLILWNTYIFFNQLKENERAKMEIWAAAYHDFIQNNPLDAPVGEVIPIIIQGNTTTPMILYTYKEKVYTEKNIDSSEVNTLEKKKRLVEKFKSEYQPIDIRSDDELLSTIYYGNSPLINKLKYYPAALILIIFLFILAVYLFYKTSKSAEQNRLWAGMAKETAHQIGTPLSSLVGWTEILKTEKVNPEYITEMEKDISRLETITDRFSKIGSVPKLERCDVVAETRASFQYLQKRSSKLIDFQLVVPDKPIYVKMNPQLFSWTIENLVKNGIDAMKGKGRITISIEKNSKFVFIRISDTGKGLTKSEYRKIFTPGHTTKKRGWGLGLSLAKRIIEEYHNGKIRVSKSIPNQGTTMEIALKTEN
ncbi:HAMP domain-containing sensor histidine kinase [Aequorivita todarodis]|uniref:sensor histidine kinase n=1 Tax=Aequorivita todarodis TaxID=2036821 RepID=UPI00234FC4FA|nr:HAMP domain-containing sensor histidine kinase [Aequorivita todarodis]MDC8002195.1 HAMP domain-containing sensor histidine kinase [Aequorivita todarodis]